MAAAAKPKKTKVTEEESANLVAAATPETELAAPPAEAKAGTGQIFPPFEELTMLIYGDQGTGKTSFFAKSGEALILAAEPGAEFLGGESRAVKRWAKDPTGKDARMDFLTLVDAIVAAKTAGKMAAIKIVVLDTVDRLHLYATQHVCAANGVAEVGDIPFGKGYSLVKNALISQVQKLQAVVSVGITSHAMTVTETKESVSGVKKDVEIRKPSADKRIAEWLAGEQNLVGYTYKAIDGSFLIKFHSDASLETKDRTGLLEAARRPFPTDFHKVRVAYEAEAEKRGIELRSKWS